MCPKEIFRLFLQHFPLATTTTTREYLDLERRSFCWAPSTSIHSLYAWLFDDSRTHEIFILNVENWKLIEKTMDHENLLLKNRTNFANFAIKQKNPKSHISNIGISIEYINCLIYNKNINKREETFRFRSHALKSCIIHIKRLWKFL